jgi:hypothetical protein
MGQQWGHQVGKGRPTEKKKKKKKKKQEKKQTGSQFNRRSARANATFQTPNHSSKSNVNRPHTLPLEVARNPAYWVPAWSAIAPGRLSAAEGMVSLLLDVTPKKKKTKISPSVFWGEDQTCQHRIGISMTAMQFDWFGPCDPQKIHLIFFYF